MENTPSDELAHANAALVLALFDVLASKNVLNRDDLDNVLTAAISKLEAMQSTNFKGGAIKFIHSLLPDVRGSITCCLLLSAG